MKIALILLSILCYNSVFSQEDSLDISIFVTPLEEILIVEQDSLALIEAPISSSEELNYKYDFYLAGFDTLTVSSFTASFTSTDNVEISESFTLLEIDDNPEIFRYENSVILPLGVMGYMEIYEYEISIYDEDGGLIITLSDFYESDE